LTEVIVNIDVPRGRSLQYPYEHLWGWVRSDKIDGEFAVRIQDEPVRFARTNRPEVDPSRYIGFSIFLDLVELDYQGKIGPDNKLVFDFLLDSYRIASEQLDFSPAFRGKFAEVRENREEKRKFVLTHCKSSFRPDTSVKALNALPEGWPISPRLEDRTSGVFDVSAHGYGEPIHQFLRTLPPGAFILDAGAGLRMSPQKNVVNMEIYDYPSTDVLAIGQDLPFTDDMFDAVLSLAVLEHVDDPFRCASELIRVLKPGARLYVAMPFLQSEHGYPSHYFNATRFGVRKLFESLRLESQFLELSNHPVFTLEQLLSQYSSGLPEPVRSRFLGMSIADFLSQSAVSRNTESDEIVTMLNENTGWMLASGTSTIFRKA
jgi:SAM-dependent methyltransferase